MYFIAEREQDKDLTDMKIDQRLKSLLLNLYILTFLVFDLTFIKREAYQSGAYNLHALYYLLTYFFLVEGYGLYLCLNSKQRIKAEEISWGATIFWHATSFLKIILFGASLSSAKHQYFSVYFLVRFTIYASTFFFILSHLRVIHKFVLKKDELNNEQNRHALWQLANFHKVFYASLLGNTIDVMAFGNDLNFYSWLSMLGIWSLYQFKNIMAVNHKWKYLKNIFQSE